jgi:tetratricopeptide (TPR) repeat protein
VGDKEAARRAVELLRRAVVAAPRPRAFYDFRWACAAGRAEDRSAIEDSIAALRARWPDSAQAWFWIGYACTKEDHARAAEAYRRSLALGLTLPTVYHNLARSLESARDFDGALEQLRLGRARHPKNERILGALAFLLQERGDAAGALEAYRAVVEHHPESARGHNNLGSALEKAGDREGAEREYRLALERDPDYAVAHLNLGSVLLGRRTWDEAATHLEAALVRDPKNAITLGNLGSLRIELGDAQAAKDLLLRAVAVDPREPTARFNLARAHQKLGELDDAVREYERVVKDHPDHAIAWRGLASILVAPGFSGRDVPRGLAAAERSVALTGGTNADALLVLSEAELQSRRPDAALRVIRRAVALPPTDAELTRRLQAQLRRCREAAER